MDEETKKYSVVEPITIDGVEHAAGAEVELTEEQVTALPEGSVRVAETPAE